SRGQGESREVQKAQCLLCNEVQDVCCHNTQRSIRALSDVITSAIVCQRALLRIITLSPLLTTWGMKRSQ
ncbi:hypothetical protein KUDE01_000642, partial [Dissostichus eleginoides]